MNDEIIFTDIIPTSVIFGNGAKLDWSTGKLEFSGDLDESAKVFFEFLKPMIDEYIKHGQITKLYFSEED